MYCVKCGQQVPESDRFCTRCGAPMEPAPAWPTTVQALRYAGFWRRSAAALIDATIVGVLWFVVSGLYDFATTRILENTAFAPDGVALGRSLLLVSGGRWFMAAMVAFLYFALPEATRRGASPGKLVMRLRVARTDGEATGMGRSALRTALKPLSAAPLMLGFLIAGWSSRKQALHDLLSGSVVLRA